MGVVDLAEDQDGRQVALKRLVFHGSADDIARARQRVRREAEVLARLHHPNIVELLEVVDEGHDLTLVMPYLPGGTLADRVARRGVAPPASVARMLPVLAGAVAAAHRAGVVHRDLKPGNVLFDADGVPHLADFGVASSRDDTAGLTATGTVVGTPGFMAPEQARGDDAGQAADVFSLGATLLFAATGDGPYGKGAPDLLMVRAAEGKVQPVPRTLPAELRRQLEWMLDPRPDRRPSAAMLAGGPAGTLVRVPLAARRRRWPRWVLPGVVVAAAAVAAVLVAARETGDRTPPTTTTTCAPLPYQPCGQPVAANTDGRACLATFDDYDGDPSNGCEVGPDEFTDGAELDGLIEATIVPRDDTDLFTFRVGDGFQVFCDGQVTVTLVAPSGVSLRLDVLDESNEILGSATSADGLPAEVRIREPDCFSNDAQQLTARVSPVGSDRSASPYTLERQGDF
jgi:hypothetical protein